MENRTVFRRLVSHFLLTVLIVVSVFLVVRYSSRNINDSVYETSTATLSEVYSQVRNNFNTLVNEQWELLSMAGDFIDEVSGNDERVLEFIKGWNSVWNFSKFFFLDSENNYCTLDGTKGVIDLGSAWKRLFQQNQNIVIDGSIPGRDAMMFFAVPAQEGLYQGFSFSAIAVAYDSETLNRELGVSAFNDSSSCYIIQPNGRIIMENEGADDLGGNFLYHIKTSSFSAEDIDELRESFVQQQSGDRKYSCYECDGESYYMFYTPVGIEDWILVAMVDSSMVDASTVKIQKNITYMLISAFGAFLLFLGLIVFYIYRKNMEDKDIKIWQQNVLFDQMADHMNDIFVLYNTRKGTVEYISTNTERVLGIPHDEAEKATGGISSAFREPEKMKELQEAIAHLEPGTSMKTNGIFWNVRTHEELIYRISAIREKDRPELVSIIFSDRTKEQEARRQIEDALMVAEHANKAKTTFLNNMSHDIRTPMNAIIGFTSLAASHLDNRDLVKDYLGKTMAASEHLLSLINDVLDMSRIESGRVKIEEKETMLPDIMHDLRNILQTDIKAKRLDFYIDTVDIVHESIFCDKLRINQILINLMSNAMKFTNPGGTVGIRVLELPGAPEGFADYEFHIKDTGIGMSKEFAAHIFEPFTREETSTVSKIQGTGLGMAITKNIVDMMAGTISVESQPDVGTEFTVSLRFRTGENKTTIKVIKSLEGFRALVADDSMDSCTSVTKMLKTIGMRPEWTTSGKEAVFRAKDAYDEKDPFHVFIIDWLMPDMNGVEVVRRIRKEIGPQTPIIILTAYDWSSIEDEAREAGVTAFCAKPLFMSELYGILQNAGSIPEAEVVEELNPEDFKGKRVLLVDDVEMNREIAETILEEAGIEVETRENGEEAVELLKTCKAGDFDLVLMDVMMPVMDGYEATRQIRKLDDPVLASIPIIAMTANAFEEDRIAAIDCGMNDHLAKPFRIKKLYEMMRKHL